MLWRRDRKPIPPGRQRIVAPQGQFSTIYAFSDVHGCAAEFLDAEARIIEDGRRIPDPKLVVLLGDYVDRGPASSKVLDLLGKPMPHGFKRIILCGNHDDEFVRMVRSPASIGSWLRFAGTATLQSYGIDAEHVLAMTGMSGLHSLIVDLVPHAHLKLIDAMPVSLQIGKFLFVHAGIKPGIEIAKQKDKDLMWIREPFMSEGPGTQLFVIHGHTPSVDPNFGRGRLGIDTSAASTGKLSVLKIVENGFFFI